MKRKQLIEKNKVEKPTHPGFEIRKVPSKTKFSSLPDAIDEGSWVANVGDDVIVRRKQNGRMVDILHQVKGFKDGVVDLWDEEQHRWFSFRLEEAVKAGIQVKILFRASASQTQ